MIVNEEVEKMEEEEDSTFSDEDAAEGRGGGSTSGRGAIGRRMNRKKKPRRLSFLSPHSQWRRTLSKKLKKGFSTYDVVYYIMRKTSGRDKLCALIQAIAKLNASGLEGDTQAFLIWRAVEGSMRDGRKIFKFLKWIESAQKMRWCCERTFSSFFKGGPAFLTLTHALDILAYFLATNYYLLDNLLWCTQVGLLRSKVIPANQRLLWVGFRNNGKVVSVLGGLSGIKLKRNYCSFYRSIVALLSEIIYLRGMSTIELKESGVISDEEEVRGSIVGGRNRRRKTRHGRFGFLSNRHAARLISLWQSARVDLVAHVMAILRIVCNLRVLLTRLKMWECSERVESLYAVVAAAVGIWKYATRRKPIKALDRFNLGAVVL